MPEPAEQLAQPTTEGPIRAYSGAHVPSWTPVRSGADPFAPSEGPRRLALPALDAEVRELLDLRAHAAISPALRRDSGALRELQRRERFYRRTLAASDALATALAVLLALVVLGGYGVRPLALLGVPLVIFASKISGLYDRDERVLDHSTSNELPRLLNLATTLALLVWLARHYVVAGAPTTVDLLTLWLLVIACLVVGRTIARRISGVLTPIERCIVIGRASVFERLEEKLGGHRRVELAGHVDAALIAADPTLLRLLAERDRIHRVIIDTDAAGTDETLETVRLANASGLQVSLVPSMLGAVGSAVAFDDIGGLVLMGVPRFGLSRSSLALKRAFDLAAGVLLVVALAPAMAVIAVAIKLESRGPVVFRQTRMGRNDRTFQLLKFRSMVDGADALKDGLRERNEARGGLFKIEADPRITRVGRALRRRGLDELPQLFNVLGGSMSLVGPRPLVIDEDRHVTGFDRRRLALTPGITGRWQTLGAARVPLAEMVKIDYLYIANWSPWLDLRIIFDTVVYLARRSGQ